MYTKNISDFPIGHKAIFILTGKESMAHKHFFPTALGLSTKRTIHQRSKGLWEGSTKIMASELQVVQDDSRSH